MPVIAMRKDGGADKLHSKKSKVGCMSKRENCGQERNLFRNIKWVGSGALAALGFEGSYTQHSNNVILFRRQHPGVSMHLWKGIFGG